MIDQRGLMRKFIVTRVDGSSFPGGKHAHCEYFVMDLNHDRHALPALAAYCVDAAAERPALVADLRARYALQSLSFQARVQPWLIACFGEMIAGDREERNHRFLEESLELVQSLGCTASEARQLVDYVFGRPVGEPKQESGGVSVTHAALCLANGIDMDAAAEAELARVWTKVEAIRAKQAAKPKHSPLPAAPAESAAPRRAFRLTLELHADTREDLVHALEDMAFRVATDDVTRGASGGCRSGATYELSVDPDQTHDSYFASLREYLSVAAMQKREQPPDYEAIEREHLGDPEGKTGIYAEREVKND
ncbi:hypothetical protein [Nevskia ramosa]|uniref:hypothetical protein n=1 Tax=Nevskia ramosa TaxID=64002 RepID=UPI003D0F1109